MPVLSAARLNPLRPQVSAGLGLYTLLLLVVWAYWPGLGGALVFDDIPNLLPWQDLGDLDSGAKLLSFITSGQGTPGRPLSLLSFVLDDQSWRPDIFSLKRSNLALHLINTCLVFWLSLTLLQRLLSRATETQRLGLALLLSAVWALHPLQASNVSYIIQRMNLLSSLFELAGMLLFLSGRSQLAQNPRRALLLCSLAVGLCMPLAILAKENGLLLCVFVLLLEAFCFPPQPARWWRLWKGLFLWLPLLAFVIYCLITYKGFTHGYLSRNFNAWERLWTQGPVLVDYLAKLLLPRLQGSGLYFDNFPVYRSLLAPWPLFCWLLLSGVMGAAFYLRKRLPLFAFGIAFYFSGHLMESTLLPLELYFEHRNYLPQLGLWLAAAALVQLLLQGRQRPLLYFFIPLPLLLAGMTHNNAWLWGHEDEQTAIWYHDNPGSLRSALSYANLLLQQQRFDELHEVLAQAQRLHPNSLILPLSDRYVRCYWQGQPTTFHDLIPLARSADYETASIIMLEKMRSLAGNNTIPGALSRGHCPFDKYEDIAGLYLAIMENPRINSPHTRTRLYEYLAEIATTQQQLNQAMHYYDAAFASSRNPVYPYRQTLLLQSAGLLPEALAYSQKIAPALTLKQRLLYPELEARTLKLQGQLQLQIQQEKSSAPRKNPPTKPGAGS